VTSLTSCDCHSKPKTRFALIDPGRLKSSVMYRSCTAYSFEHSWTTRILRTMTVTKLCSPVPSTAVLHTQIGAGHLLLVYLTPTVVHSRVWFSVSVLACITLCCWLGLYPTFNLSVRNSLKELSLNSLVNSTIDTWINHFQSVLSRGWRI
jgi:hypothetical protein